MRSNGTELLVRLERVQGPSFSPGNRKHSGPWPPGFTLWRKPGKPRTGPFKLSMHALADRRLPRRSTASGLQLLISSSRALAFRPNPPKGNNVGLERAAEHHGPRRNAQIRQARQSVIYI